MTDNNTAEIERRDARIAKLEQGHERRIAQLEFRLEESSAVIRAMSKWTRCEHCEEK